jgi:uncharacterized protein (TIGR02594 family)
MLIDISKSLVPPWFFYAIAELGQAEIPGEAANARIVEYLKSVGQPGSDEIAWCAAEVNFVLAAAGLAGTGKPNAKSYLTWGVPTRPRIGAVVVLSRGDQEWQGHVGFVAQVNYETIYVIGGNQGDRVSIASYLKTRVIDYRWPAGV